MNLRRDLLICSLYCTILPCAFSWSNKGLSLRSRGYKIGRQQSSLYVLGFFQGKDEKGIGGATDETVAASLVEVSDVVDSMNRFKTSQKVSDRTNLALQELALVTVEGSSADGKVKVLYNGKQQPVDVQIDEVYFQSLGRKSGAAELNIALTEAMKKAHKKAAAKMEDKLKTLYSDLGFGSL